MKQLLFMMLTTLAGTAGVFIVSPFWGVAIYYLFAVLRPQFMWKWSLPPDVQWSLFVAVATILGAIAVKGGFMHSGSPDDSTVTPQRQFSWPHWAVIGFGIWVAFGCLIAVDPGAAYPWLIEYTKILVMFTVSTILIRSVDQIWTLFVLSALAIGYIAYEINFLYVFNGRYTGIYHNGYGGLDNNGAGLMLAMGVPLCAAVWQGTSRIWRWGFAALIPVLLHAVLLTYSRGAMVALLLGSPLIFWRSRHRVQIGIAGLCLILLLPSLAGNEIRRRFFSVQQYQEDDSAQSRFASWAAGWQIAKENPVFGVGLRNSNLFSQKYGADLEGRTIHSQYLQVAADNGLVGLGLYLCMLAAFWRVVRRARRLTAHLETVEGRQTNAVACGISNAMAVFCIGACFLSLETFELPYLLLLLGAQLGTIAVPALGRVRTGSPVVAPLTSFPSGINPAFVGRSR